MDDLRQAPAQTLLIDRPFTLETGGVLPQLTIAYHTFGTRQPNDANVLWVCHALTANSNPIDWWPGLVGPGCLYDPDRWFIVCANIVGSCYGTTGPHSPNPTLGRPYYADFPLVTIRDMVQAHILLRQHLGIGQIHTLIGGSLGGQQVLEWAVTEPDIIQRIVPVATNAWHSPWGIAYNEAQRLALLADPTYHEHRPDAGAAGLRAARSIAMLSYRTYNAYGQTQAEPSPDRADDFRAASYQRYQGDKLVRRFNAHAYWALGKAMDSHNLGRNRPGGAVEVLRQLDIPALVVAIASDELFPPAEQQFLARHLPRAVYAEVPSDYGHDGFLIEADALTAALTDWYENE